MYFNKNHKKFKRELHNFYAKNIFKMVAMWACAASLNSQKILFKSIKFDSPCHSKKIKSALFLQNK
jgi:hypothetical protein